MTLNVTIVLCVSIVISFWLYWLWQRRYYYKLSFQLPTLWGLPILGIVLQMGSVINFLPFLQNFWQHNKPRTILAWVGLKPTIITVDPCVVEQVLTGADFREKSHAFYAPLRNALRGGMIALPCMRVSEFNEEEKHLMNNSPQLLQGCGELKHSKLIDESQHKRKIFASTLRHKQLLGVMPIMNAKSKEFLCVLEEKCQQGGAHKLLMDLQMCALKIAKETTMGHTEYKSPDALAKVLNRMFSAFHYVFYEMILNCANLGFLARLSPIRYWKIRKLYEFGDEIFTYRANQLKQQPMVKESQYEQEQQPLIFIDQALRYHQNGELTWQQIVGEATAFIVASFETNSSVMHSTLFLLAMHPQIQNQVYDEVYACFPDKEFEVQYEHFAQLNYMEMIIKEAMRLFPPGPLLSRENDKPATLNVNGQVYVIPAHTQIVIDLLNIQREPSLWGANANCFNPENFLPQNAADRHAYAYLPFSKGSRNCVGWNYAYFAMKVLLAHLIRNYRFHTTFKYENIKLTSTLFLNLAEQPPISIERRD